ncbi:MAG: hypothetical protein II336_17975 [Loktanella sp.]|nr:hypothetical protein [Loktanella sp.]
MTALTVKQHTVLAHLSDGDWRQGYELASAGVLGVLQRRELIRDDMSVKAMEERLWTITPDGLAALERAGQ